MKRILEVIGSMDCGGAENLLMNLLRNINKNEYKVDFLINKKEKCFFEDEILSFGCSIHRIPKFNIVNYFSYKRNLKKIFSEHNYDIVHGHIGSSSGIYLKIAKQSGCSCILHSHNTFREKPTLRDKIFKIFSKKGNRYADFFIACSKQSAIDRFGSKANDKNCFILNNGINVEKNKFNFDIRKSYRKNLGFDDKTLVLGHIGRMVEQKNHIFLIKILSALTNTYNVNAKLLLLGDGPLRQDIEKFAKQNNMFNKIHFVGTTNCPYLYLNCMDAFIMPSLYEGLPLSIIEAQCNGLNCFISDKVPNDCMITNHIYSISLAMDPKFWAKKIFECKQIHRDDSQTIKKAGFDCRDVAETIEKIYSKF